MAKTIWSAEYTVNTLVLNAQKRLGLHGLLTILQDVAWNHAEDLGCGYDSMARCGAFWVLTRQAVRMQRWPDWGETLTIDSWARPFSGPLAPRDFQIRCADVVIGEATSLWLTLDGKTHRPLRHPEAITCRQGGALDLQADKIAPIAGLPRLATRQVQNSDLDMNGHVNNTHYARWILDSLPAAALARFKAAQYSVNFLTETGPGEEVAIQGAPCIGETGTWQFQGCRSDGKPLFTAQLTPAADGPHYPPPQS